MTRQKSNAHEVKGAHLVVCVSRTHGELRWHGRGALAKPRRAAPGDRCDHAPRTLLRGGCSSEKAFVQDSDRVRPSVAPELPTTAASLAAILRPDSPHRVVHGMRRW